MQRDVSERSLRDDANLRDGVVNACDTRQPEVSGRSLSKKRARAPETQVAGWRLEPHVCRHCFGRLVSQAAPSEAEPSRRQYLCTNCGADALGQAPDVLCSCGTMLRRHGTGAAPMNAGLRCQPNPAPTPDFPSLFVAAEART